MEISNEFRYQYYMGTRNHTPTHIGQKHEDLETKFSGNVRSQDHAQPAQSLILTSTISSVPGTSSDEFSSGRTGRLPTSCPKSCQLPPLPSPHHSHQPHQRIADARYLPQSVGLSQPCCHRAAPWHAMSPAQTALSRSSGRKRAVSGAAAADHIIPPHSVRGRCKCLRQ